MTETAWQDGRRGQRRMQPKTMGSYPGVSPGLIIAVPGKALPGELAPLKWRRGRVKPVSEQEALGVWRRKKRADIAKSLAGDDAKALQKLTVKGLPAEHEAQVPAELPMWSSKKVMVAFRLHPRLRALVDALGEIEGTNFAAEVELALWKLVNSTPRDPDEVREELTQMAAETVLPEKLQQSPRA